MTQEHPPLTEGVYYILLALFDARHGYGIMQLVEEMSDGRVRLGAGTIYGAIKTLLERGWIEALDGDGRKRNTSLQRVEKVVEYEILRLRELLTTASV